MQGQKLRENVNVREAFFNLHVNYMAAFDWIKLLRLKDILQSVEASSSPNSPLLFATVFWGKTNRSSLSQMFFKIGVHKKFRKFHRKTSALVISLFLIKLQVWRPEMLRTPFLTEHLQWLLLNKPSRSLWFIVWRSDALII